MDKIWPHDADLQASGHSAREHTTKGVETILVIAWDHLRNVHHQRSLRIAVLNSWEVSRVSNKYTVVG